MKEPINENTLALVKGTFLGEKVPLDILEEPKGKVLIAYNKKLDEAACKKIARHIDLVCTDQSPNPIDRAFDRIREKIKAQPAKTP